MHRFRERRNAGLLRDLQTIDGAVQAVANIHAQYASRIACASGADRFKVELQLGKCGLMTYFKGTIFSGHELPRSKPAPDAAQHPQTHLLLKRSLIPYDADNHRRHHDTCS